MPDFEIEPSYKDPESLADVIDDVFQKYDDKKKDTYSYSYGSKGEGSSKDIDTVTDAEAMKLCTEWKKNYSVVTGVSWGNLPYDLQQKWLHYSCDYHLTDSSYGGGASSSSRLSNEESERPADKLKDDFTI